MQVIYVSAPESQRIYVWRMNQCGMLTLLQIVNTYVNAQPIVIHPNKKILYVGIRPIFGVISYRIDKYGMLHKKNFISLPGSPTYLSIDYNRKNLFCALYHNNSIMIIPLNYKGSFGFPIKILTKLIKCHSVNIDEVHHKLWVPCLGEDCIRIFDIDVMGKLLPYFVLLLKMERNSGPRHMVFNKNKNFAYVINEFNSNVNVISMINNNCALKIVQTINIMPNLYNSVCWGADIHITYDDKWLYCSDRAANIISYCKILSNGMLQLFGHQLTEIQPRSFVIDHTDRFLIVAGQKSNTIAVYEINKYNGSLKFLSKYPVANGPAWVTILNIY